MGECRMAGTGDGAGGARRSTAVSRRLQQIRARKAELDADRRERERLENAALKEFAHFAAQADKLASTRDEQIAKRQQQIAQIKADKDAQIREAHVGQGVALLKLPGKAEEVAGLVELPVNEVYRLRRLAQETARTEEPSGADRKATGDGHESSGAVEQNALEEGSAGPVVAAAGDGQDEEDSRS